MINTQELRTLQFFLFLLLAASDRSSVCCYATGFFERTQVVKKICGMDRHFGSTRKILYFYFVRKYFFLAVDDGEFSSTAARFLELFPECLSL
jgi:hypothetical protein